MIHREANKFNTWEINEYGNLQIFTDWSDTNIYDIPPKLVFDIASFFDQYVKSKTEIIGEFDLAVYLDKEDPDYDFILKLKLKFFDVGFTISGRTFAKDDDDTIGDYYHNFELSLESEEEWNEFYKYLASVQQG